MLLIFASMASNKKNGRKYRTNIYRTAFDVSAAAHRAAAAAVPAVL